MLTPVGSLLVVNAPTLEISTGLASPAYASVRVENPRQKVLGHNFLGALHQPMALLGRHHMYQQQASITW